MEPKSSMDEEERKRNGRPATPLDMRDAGPRPLVNNYMGPPEAQTQVAEPMRAGPTGFVGFGQQLGANVEAAERMAQQTGRAALESGQVGMLGTEGGRTALLQKALGRAAEVSPLDAALAGAAGGDYFGQLQADYGPEAQARRAADMAAARADAASAQQAQGERAKAPAQRQARLNAAAAEAARLRAIDAKRPIGQIKAEEWARNHGLTLEQWIAGGKQPPF
jgi:hypothetical protein